MRQRILLLVVLVATLGSCTTMYKSGQTPDDVYFSPAREETGYVEVEERRDNGRRFEDDNEYLSDRYLRMKSVNRNRWSTFDDDFMYWNNPMWNNQVYFNSFRPGWGWNNPWAWNSPWGWNSWGWGGFHPGMSVGFNYWNNPFWSPFNPGFFGAPVIVTRPVNPRAYIPRNGNLNTYYNRTFNTDPKTGGRIYNLNSAPRTFRSNGTGGYYTAPSYRSPRTYSGSDNSRSFSAPSRSFDRSGGVSESFRSSGGSSGGGGGSAPVRSFPRGN